jgi:hypothetical protein
LFDISFYNNPQKNQAPTKNRPIRQLAEIDGIIGSPAERGFKPVELFLAFLKDNYT